MKEIDVYVVNPVDQTVLKQKMPNDNSLDWAYHVIKCDTVTMTDYPCDKVPSKYLQVMLDDNGLLHSDQRYWRFKDMSHTVNNAYAGIGIITGFDYETGALADNPLDLEQMTAEIEFMEKGYDEEPMMQFAFMGS